MSRNYGKFKIVESDDGDGLYVDIMDMTKAKSVQIPIEDWLEMVKDYVDWDMETVR